jgi:hypothetical protein
MDFVNGRYAATQSKTIQEQLVKFGIVPVPVVEFSD